MKTKFIILIGIIVLGIVGWLVFKGEGESPYDFAIVERGDVVEEVSETGTVKPAQDVNLRFEISGTVEKVYVSEGQEVKQGAYLIRLYTGKLYSQFLQAQASYNQAKAELDQLLAGSTSEEIQVAERVVENAKVTLEDAKTKADNDLAEKYDDALVYLGNASSDANIALADLKNLEINYFSGSSTIANTFRTKEDVAREAFFGITSLNKKGAQEIANVAISNPTQENIDSALTEMRTAINKIKDSLDYTRNAMSDPTLRENVSSTDQATVDTDTSNMSTALTNISTAQQAIDSQKVINQTNINSAENTLKKAEDDLAKVKATPREVDIIVYQASVDKAEASMVELQQKLNDAVIEAPISGVISRVNVKVGEVVTAGSEVVVSLISASKFEIEVDIYEEDIVKVKTGNSVNISVVAFPDEILKGRVISIEPAEKIIEGVVYYEVTISFDEIKEGIRPTMTADIVIKTASRENVLVVPEGAVQKKNGKFMVRVSKDDLIEEREIKVGLEGSDDKVEVISGLEEGEKVIIE